MYPAPRTVWISGRAAAVDLAAQPADVRLDDVGLRIEMVLPDLFEQHLARDEPALGAHQEFEQPELARLKVDRLSAAAHGAGDEVHFEIAAP